MNKATFIVMGLTLVFAALVLLAISSGFDNHNQAYQGVKAAKPTETKANVPAASESSQASVAASGEKAAAVRPGQSAEVLPEKEKTDKPVRSALYSVVDGNKLDADSYAGFKLFRNWCARCHGTYGQGMVGPNLAERLQVLTKEEFFSTVEHGKTGQIGNMPAWKNNMKVMQGRDKLYAYLKARADGAIGAVKPKKQ